MPIPLHVEDRGEGDWQGPIQGEFARPFAADDAPARCILLRLPGRTVLSLTFFHPMADGRSGTALMRDLLRAALRGGAVKAVAQVPPPMHAAFPSAFRWGDQPERARDLAQQIAEDALIRGTPADVPFLAHREPRREPRLTTIRLNAAHGRRLQERCRAERTTVHGAVCAAQLIATNGLFADEAARTLYLICPADLRGQVTADLSGQLSFCSTLVRSTFLVEGPQAFWSLAREVSADLRRRLDRGDGHMTYASLPLERIGGSGPAFDGFAAALDHMPAGSNVSNIGRVEPLDDCPEVTAISFALCAMPKHVASLNASSYRDELIVNMTFDAAKLQPATADAIAAEVSALLEKAAGD